MRSILGCKRAKGYKSQEDVSFRRITEPLPAATILTTKSEVLGEEVESFRQRRRSSTLRGIAARALLRFGGLTQRQAAAELKMGTGGAVSAQVRRLPALIAEDRKLRREVARVDRRLEGLMSGQDGKSGHGV